MFDPNKKVKIVFACLDWRLHPQIEKYFVKSGDGCDMCVTGGSIKALIDPLTQGFMIEQVNISKRLHNCQAVILTMHIDCGAYGGSKAYANPEEEIAVCKEQLSQAKEIIEKNFSGLPIESYIISLECSEGNWIIEPKKI